jgi:hypothetical protein
MVSRKRTKRKARQAARAKAREEEKKEENGGNNQTMTNNNKQQQAEAEAQSEQLHIYPGSPEWNDLIEAKARMEFEKKIGKPSVADGDAAYLEWLQTTDLYSSHFDNPPFTSLAALCFDRQMKEALFGNRNGSSGGNDIPTQSTGENEKNDG